MKRILIRAGVSPIDTLSAEDILLTNPIEDNIGNLLFQNSIFRTFMNEEVQVDPDYYSFDSSEDRAEEINNTYDYYLLPLANYFRESYIPYLNKQTELIKQLKIPVVVIGVGLQAPTDSKIEDGFSFDSDVRDFIKSVLDRSSIIGVRGETTGRYLKHLGFKEEADFTVIGCPSMYTFGENIHIDNRIITKNSTVSVNSARKRIDDSTAKYIESSAKSFKNHFFIPQDIDELKLIYTGRGDVKYKSKYTNYMKNDIYNSSSVRFPLNVSSWLTFLKEVDLVFGARIHGNIAGTLAGIPSVIFPIDTRTLELAEFHGLNCIHINDSSKNIPFIELLSEIDFRKPEKKHKSNFTNYLKFLDKNNLDHIYKSDPGRADAPYDKLVASVKYPNLVRSSTSCSDKILLKRLNSYYPKLETSLQKDLKEASRDISKLRDSLYKTKTRLRAANLAIDKRNSTLERKAVRLALKISYIIKGDFLKRK